MLATSGTKEIKVPNDDLGAPYYGRIVSSVLEVTEPVRIVLFGSRARGEARPDSDVDLMVLCDVGQRDLIGLAGDIRYALLWMYPMEKDVICEHVDAFERRRDLRVSFESNVAVDGVALYENSVPVSLDYERPNAESIEAIREAKRIVADGGTHRYKDANDMIDSLGL